MPAKVRKLFFRALWRIKLILDHEPSWREEFGAALGLFSWGILTLLGDYSGGRASLVLPWLAIAFGPLRWALLLRLHPLPRVLAAGISFMWLWALILASFRQYGFAGTQGFEFGFAALDLIIIAKFSLWAWRLEDDGRTA